jgi:hypothetical protein
MRWADHSSRGVLPTVLRRCVWSRNIRNGCSMYIYDISRLRVKMYGLKIFPCALVWYQMMTRCQNIFDLQCINMFLNVYVVGISCIIVSLHSKTVIICSWWSLDTLNYDRTRCGHVVTVWHDSHTQTCPGVTQWRPARVNQSQPKAVS